MNCERMCIVCRTMRDRTELFRVSKNSQGIFVDTENKIQGRGAYICKMESCVLNARKRSSLERSLSSAVDSSVYDMLEDLVKNAE